MALGDLFDSPWKILIIAAVVLILFGSKKMPDAARSLGRSMRILKTEIKDMRDDDGTSTEATAQPQPVPQQQLTAPVAGVPVTPADGVPMAAAPVAPVAPAVAPVPPVAPAAPPASVPVPEVQQDTRPV